MLPDLPSDNIFQEYGFLPYYSRAVRELWDSLLPSSWTGTGGPIDLLARFLVHASLKCLVEIYERQCLQYHMHQFNSVKAKTNITYPRYTRIYATKCIAEHAKSLFYCLGENEEHVENRM